MECPICVDITELISPPPEYCDHEMCMSCWINTGKRNPLCPICRCDLTKWMKSLGIDVNSKERFDHEEFSTPSLEMDPTGWQDIFSNNFDDSDYDSYTEQWPDSEDSDIEDSDSEEIDYPEEPGLRNPSGNDPYYARYDLGSSTLSDFYVASSDEPSQPHYVPLSQDPVNNIARIGGPLHSQATTRTLRNPMIIGSVLSHISHQTTIRSSPLLDPIFTPFFTFSSHLIVENSDRVRVTVIYIKPTPNNQKLRNFERQKPNLRLEKRPKNFHRVNQPRSHKQKYSRKR